MITARGPGLALIAFTSLIFATTASRVHAEPPLTAKEWGQLPKGEADGRIGNDLLSVLQNRWLDHGGEWNDFYGTKLATRPRDLGGGLCGADVLAVEYAGSGKESDRRLHPSGLRVEHRFRFLNVPNDNTPDSPFYDEQEKAPPVKTACDQLGAGPPWHDWMIADRERQIRELALLLPILTADMKSGRIKASNCATENDTRCRDRTGPFHVEQISYVRDCASDSFETCYVIDSQAGGYAMVLRTEAFNPGGKIGRIKSVAIGGEYTSGWGERLYR